MSPEQQEATERLMAVGLRDSLYLSGSVVEKVYSGDVDERNFRRRKDLAIVAQLYLHENPADSTCSLTRQELIAENERLRKILAHVPGRIAIKAKEDAGFPNYIHATGAFDDTIGAVLGEKTKQ